MPIDRNGLGPRDAMLDIVCAGQAALDQGRELAAVQMDFNAAFDPVLVSKYFWSFLLPVLEYFSPIWMSAADSHVRLLDRVVRQ